MATDEVTEAQRTEDGHLRAHVVQHLLPGSSWSSLPFVVTAKLAILLHRAKLGALLQMMSSRGHPPLVVAPHSS
jgi:hypothetical protein